MNTLRSAAILFTSILATACATMTEVYNPRSPTNTTPSQTMDAVEAKRAITEVVQKFHGIAEGNWNVSTQADSRQFVINYMPGPKNPNGQPQSTAYPYGTPDGLVVSYDGSTGYYGVYYKSLLLIGWFEKENAVRFVDAVLAYEKYSMTDHVAAIATELAQFEPVAKSYRAKSPKPSISEDTRKFQVQAENAFDEKRYDDAIHYYQKGLEISPWWPDGHYNLAMILGQQGFLPEADTEIKKYLALVPDAPDARKAKDKMYVWEGKLELTGHSVSTPNPVPASK